jgi:hypothetical protein
MLTVVPEGTRLEVSGAPGNRYVVNSYLGSPTQARPGAQAFLVRQEKPLLRPHFHEVDQFQVVIDGSGQFGGDDALPGLIHYTDAYTAYGPIRTNPAAGGLTYLTLRRQAAVGANYMPESRDKRRQSGGGGEHFVVQLGAFPGEMSATTELARTARGAVAFEARAAAGEKLGLPAGGNGQEGYAVVFDGGIRIGGRDVGKGGLVWFTGLAELAPARAAAHGSTVAVLLFAPGIT